MAPFGYGLRIGKLGALLYEQPTITGSIKEERSIGGLQILPSYSINYPLLYYTFIMLEIQGDFTESGF